MVSAAPSTAPEARLAIRVRGAVQGVGFRPFVCRVARGLGLAGFVRNGADGVEVEAEGRSDSLQSLLTALRAVPAPARVDEVESRPQAARGDADFRVAASVGGAAGAFPLLPDLVTCAECLAEVLDPRDRRFRHPFASCARCGPRYSIAVALPWDRGRTAMASFEPCAACRAEHDDPRDRRFHAQTLACPDCGPQLAWADPAGRPDARGDPALRAGVALLRAGGILALLGVGGFQLLALACDEAAVRRLRARKHRPEKPLALCVRDAEAASRLVTLRAGERAALASPAGPIVLARRRPGAEVAPSVAPGLAWLGVMLPATPLHRLLLEDLGRSLVVTSGNRAGEPLSTTLDDAREALAGVADGFLSHDRPVLRPVDDSVVREIAGRVVTLRCARGLAPQEVAAVGRVPPIAALGGDLKAAVAVGARDRILLGPHLGDLASARVQDAAVRDVRALGALAGVAPDRIAADAHPDGHAGRLAGALDPAALRVQHHHAHVLSCVAEHRAELPVLGFAWDGTGHGGDDSVWGGELLHVDAAGAERLGHLRRFRLPGGEAAVREPRRAALGLLWERFGCSALGRSDPALAAFPDRDRAALGRLLESGRFAPWTSSAGRLFDAVAALLGVRQVGSYEGQAALELESLAAPDPDSRAYPLGFRGRALDWAPLLDELLADRDTGVPRGVIATRFHRGLAGGIVASAGRAARQTGTRRVVLTGGCFQNALLTGWAREGLANAGLEPLLHERVPPGDGGLAVGQIVAVSEQARRRALGGEG